MKPELLHAYHHSLYQVDEPLWQLHIGQLHPAFDCWLATQGAQTWAFITAYNPRSELLSVAENACRQAALEQSLRAAGYRCFSGRGYSSDPDSLWLPEISVLVLDMPHAVALATGQHWQQNAVVWGHSGQSAELVLCP